jgi:hypothetical protein
VSREIFFVCTLFNTDSSAAPEDSTVSGDAVIEPRRTVATLALASRRSNHSARFHPHSAISRPNSARTHPQLGYVSSTLGWISSTLG